MSLSRRAAQALRVLVCMPITLLAAVSFACSGGGGGGGGGPTNPGGGPLMASLQSSAPVSNGIALQAGAAASVSQLEIEVVATEVVDLYGIAFDLSYPAAALRFDGVSEGVFLSDQGTSTSIQTSASGSTIIVGLTRLGAVSGRTGTGVLMTLRFTATAVGSGALTFSNQQAIDGLGSSVRGLSWSGGTATVVR